MKASLQAEKYTTHKKSTFAHFRQCVMCKSVCRGEKRRHSGLCAGQYDEMVCVCVWVEGECAITQKTHTKKVKKNSRIKYHIKKRPKYTHTHVHYLCHISAWGFSKQLKPTHTPSKAVVAIVPAVGDSISNRGILPERLTRCDLCVCVCVCVCESWQCLIQAGVGSFRRCNALSLRQIWFTSKIVLSRGQNVKSRRKYVDALAAVIHRRECKVWRVCVTGLLSRETHGTAAASQVGMRRLLQAVHHVAFPRRQGETAQAWAHTRNTYMRFDDSLKCLHPTD